MQVKGETSACTCMLFPPGINNNSVYYSKSCLQPTIQMFCLLPYLHPPLVPEGPVVRGTAATCLAAAVACPHYGPNTTTILSMGQGVHLLSL